MNDLLFYARTTSGETATLPERREKIRANLKDINVDLVGIPAIRFSQKRETNAKCASTSGQIA
jgi:hypothetical protein